MAILNESLLENNIEFTPNVKNGCEDKVFYTANHTSSNTVVPHKGTTGLSARKRGNQAKNKEALKTTAGAQPSVVKEAIFDYVKGVKLSKVARNAKSATEDLLDNPLLSEF